ncbi:hypothetical protein Taro_005960 [Colocasia esculenta]|uniref:Probable magnesium transporter n=1 Tax=Colocasia esculenta TaxID=4460 RepID=A0A843TTY7_COLES|nr:hypothetical protein [Colocasia esculenta]
MIATTFIVFGNIFLVSFGNHQSPVFTPEQLTEKYRNLVFLCYCIILLLIVAANHYIYRKGELYVSVSIPDLNPYWHMLLSFSYAVVSGAIGSCSVLFAKSLSNLLRLAMSSGYHLHSWFTYSMLLLFLSTAGFWMARLNEGLSLFDAILIVPMFQISWTFFSICTGFVYFQEYQVFDSLRITMFILGMSFVFIGISLLAPDDSKGGELKDPSLPPSLGQGIKADMNRLGKQPAEETGLRDMNSLQAKTKFIISRAKAACSLSIGLGEESINASSVLVMPMVSSRTTGFRGTIFDRTKFNSSLKGSGWTNLSMDIIDDEDDVDMQDRSLLLPHSSS